MSNDQFRPFMNVLNADIWDSCQSADPPMLSSSKADGSSMHVIPPKNNGKLISSDEPPPGGTNAAGISHVHPNNGASGQTLFDDVLVTIPDSGTVASNGMSIEDFEPFEFDLEAIWRQHPLPVESFSPLGSGSSAPLSPFDLNIPCAVTNQGTHNDFSDDGNLGGLDEFDAFFRPAADATVQATLTLPTPNGEVTSSATVGRATGPGAIPDVQTLPPQPTTSISTSANKFERCATIKLPELLPVFPASLIRTNPYLGGTGDLHAVSETNSLDQRAVASMFYLPSGDFMPPISVATQPTTTGVAPLESPSDISDSSVIRRISKHSRTTNEEEKSLSLTTGATPSTAQPHEAGGLDARLLFVPYAPPVPPQSPKGTRNANKRASPANPGADRPPSSTQQSNIKKASDKQKQKKRESKSSWTEARAATGFHREVRHKEGRPDAAIPCSFLGCTQVLSSDQERRRHESLHGQTEQSEWFCPACGRQYSRDDALIRHLNNLRKVVPNHPCVLLAVGLGWEPGVNGTGSNLRPGLLRDKGYAPRSRTDPPAIQTTETTGSVGPSDQFSLRIS